MKCSEGEESTKRREGSGGLLLVEVERLVEEVLDLRQVDRLLSSRGRRGRVPSGVDRGLGLVVLGRLERGEQSRLDVRPRPSVERLLLAPCDVGVGELVDVGREEVVRERRDLLDSAEDNVLDASVLSLLEQSLVDLSRADDYPLHLRVGGHVGRRLGDEPLELGLTDHLGQVRSRVRVSEQVLGEEDDELRETRENGGSARLEERKSNDAWTDRLPEVSVDLTTEDVEVVCGRGGVDDLEVAVLVLSADLLLRGEHVRVVVTQLEESLDSSRRVLRSLSVVSMGQRHDETSSLEPLSLSGRDELVNDDLASVRKVSELS